MSERPAFSRRSGAGRRRTGRAAPSPARAAPPQPGGASLRSALLALDESDLARVQQQIRDYLAPESETLRRYRRGYERSLPRGGRPLARRQVIAAARRADVALVGDYHTLPEAQRGALGLAMELGRERPLVLGLEMVRVERQEAVDAYLEGRHGDLEFLAAVDYGDSWPFPWAHYRPLLDTARRAGWPVVALDSAGSSAARDRRAAAVLERSLARHPGALHVVLIGDLHLAPSHLPRRIHARCPATRLVVIHQNEPQVYHDLVARGLDLRAAAVVLGPSRFCLMNATPLRRERSYLAWIENRWGGGRPAATDAAAEFAATVARVARLLGLERPAGDWEVVSGQGLPFLAALERSGAPAARLARVRREITRRGRTLVSELRLLYARTPLADDLAELAMQALCEEAGEPPPLEPDPAAGPIEVEIALFAGLRREALAYMASCLLHPFRGRRGSFAAAAPPVSPGARSEALARELLAALSARARRRRALRLGHRLRALAPDQLWEITLVAGRRLGRNLFDRLVAGQIEPARVRRLTAPPRGGDRRRRERQALIELAVLAFGDPPPARPRRRR